jgi:hypothetical protein
VGQNKHLICNTLCVFLFIKALPTHTQTHPIKLIAWPVCQEKRETIHIFYTHVLLLLLLLHIRFQKLTVCETKSIMSALNAINDEFYEMLLEINWQERMF